MEMEFLHPQALWFWLAAFPVFAMLLREAKFGRYFRSSRSSGNGNPWAHVFRAASWSLVVVTLSFLMSDPRYPFVRELEKKEWTDIVFVFDISKSMLAEDLSPNRLEAAKRVLANFVAKRDWDRFWLVVFAWKPFLLSPLTDDIQAFSAILSKVTTDTIRQEIPGFSGTNIGEWLLLASESLTWTLGDKNVVLVTDWEANVGIDPKPVAKLLAEKKVKIHSIGIWDPKGIDLFVTNKSTGEKSYFLWPDGKPIRAIVDAELMAFISTTTSWTFANASDVSGLESVFKALDDSTKKESVRETVKRFSSARTPFLLALLLFLTTFVALSRTVSDDPSV